MVLSIDDTGTLPCKPNMSWELCSSLLVHLLLVAPPTLLPLKHNMMLRGSVADDWHGVIFEQPKMTRPSLMDASCIVCSSESVNVTAMTSHLSAALACLIVIHCRSLSFLVTHCHSLSSMLKGGS